MAIPVPALDGHRLNAADASLPSPAERQPKILYISDEYYPCTKANCEQALQTVAALSREGADIRFVTPRRWRDLITNSEARKQAMLTGFTGLGDFSMTQLVLPPLLLPPLTWLSHAVMAPLYATLARADVIYSRNALAAWIGVQCGRAVLYETYRTFDRLDSPLARRLAKTSSRRFLGIVTHSQISKASFLEAGVADTKLAVIPNGHDPAALEPRERKQDARAVLGWPEDRPAVCYAGRIDVEKGILAILELAARSPEIDYWLIGPSQRDRAEWVLRAAAERNLENIHVRPWVPMTSLRTYLYAADILLIPPTAEPLRAHGKTVLPMKTYLYMGVGRPIVAPRLPDIDDVLDDGNAMLVTPDDYPSAVARIRSLLRDAALAERLGQKARANSKQYTWGHRAKRIMAFVHSRLPERRLPHPESASRSSFAGP